MSMINKFLGNENGNFAVTFAIAALPIMGSIVVAVDYTNVSRLKFELSNSVDSMCIVASREFMAGKSNSDVETAAKKFFEANLDKDLAKTATTSFTMPNAVGNANRTMDCRGQLTYSPMFEPALAFLMNREQGEPLVVKNEAKMKMPNVAEIALVLDNSGSMAFDKNGNENDVPLEKQRITLLKSATKKLITQLVDRSKSSTSATPAVKLSIVPFSVAVNVGKQYQTASWMDTQGVSPVHHENLNWGAPGPNNPTGYMSDRADGAKLDAKGNPLTRFSILNALQFRTGGTVVPNQCEHWKVGISAPGDDYSNCFVFRRTGTTAVSVVSDAAASATSYHKAWLANKYRWSGCVEARPNGLDVSDADAIGKHTFVPFFAPDELNVTQTDGDFVKAGRNSWWPDLETNEQFVRDGHWAPDNGAQLNANKIAPAASDWQQDIARPREVDVRKYFLNKPYTDHSGPDRYQRPRSQYDLFARYTGPLTSFGWYVVTAGPNDGCATTPITPLTNDETKLHNAVDVMKPTNGTNIPEGIAWGWRTISPKEPFSQGVPYGTKGVDKIAIVLTDGANTYPYYSIADGDMAGNKTYNYAYGRTGYAGKSGPGGTASPANSDNYSRMFYRTSANKTEFSVSSYNLAMDQKMIAVCTNMKKENITVIMIALDMDPINFPDHQKNTIKKSIKNMTTCASESKRKKDSKGKFKKLFWSASSDTLDETYQEITEELSNFYFTQ